MWPLTVAPSAPAWKCTRSSRVPSLAKTGKESASRTDTTRPTVFIPISRSYKFGRDSRDSPHTPATGFFRPPFPTAALLISTFTSARIGPSSLHPATLSRKQEQLRRPVARPARADGRAQRGEDALLEPAVGEKHGIACPSALIGASDFFETARDSCAVRAVSDGLRGAMPSSLHFRPSLRRWLDAIPGNERPSPPRRRLASSRDAANIARPTPAS